MNRRIRGLVVLALALMALTVSAGESEQEPGTEQFYPSCLDGSDRMTFCAQAPCMQPPHRDGRGGEGAPFMKRRERLERFRMKKMMEVLDLRPEQKEKVLAFISRHREEQKNLLAERHGLMEQLGHEIHADTPKESEILDLLAAIKQLEQRQHEHRLQFMDQAGRLLNPEQLARLLVFHEHFEARMFDQLKGMRQHEAGKHNRKEPSDRNGTRPDKNSTDG
ncbi:MAG: hypothetical protein P1R58_00410 [bacterium]|nr:hypothetical protein [bacterium]